MKILLMLALLYAAVWMKCASNPIWPFLRFLCRASHLLLAACIMTSWVARDAVRFVRAHWDEAEREATRVATAKPEPVEPEPAVAWREREA